jgi:hypothetical protein
MVQVPFSGQFVAFIKKASLASKAAFVFLVDLHETISKRSSGNSIFIGRN